MAKHLFQGIQFRDKPIVIDLIREVGLASHFIPHDHTYQWFKKEPHFPSPVIDRQRLELWETSGALSAWDRAKTRVDSLIAKFKDPILENNLRKELRQITTKAAQSFGMDQLPTLPG